MKKYIVIDNDSKKNEMLVFYGKEETEIFFDLYLTAFGVKDISYFTSISENDNKMIRSMVESINLSCIAYYEKGTEKSKNKKRYRLFIGSTGILRLLGFLFDFNYLKFNDDVYDWVIGELCNIPNCCIEKWMEFSDTHKMVDNYFQQLNGKKDKYNLKDDGHNITSDRLNFIPCSPYCQGTKTRQTIYNKLWKKMHDDLGIGATELKKKGLCVTGEGVEYYTITKEGEAIKYKK